MHLIWKRNTFYFVFYGCKNLAGDLALFCHVGTCVVLNCSQISHAYEMTGDEQT